MDTQVTSLPAPIEQHARTVTHCIFRKGDHILVEKGFDSLKGETFYRPPGGKIKFGEYSWLTIRRQIKEAIGEEIKNLSFFGPARKYFHLQRY